MADTATELPQLMNTAELGEFLRTPPETVRYWRYCGRGPKSFKLDGGRRVFYARDDVLSWLAEQQATST